MSRFNRLPSNDPVIETAIKNWENKGNIVKVYNMHERVLDEETINSAVHNGKPIAKVA